MDVGCSPGVISRVDSLIENRHEYDRRRKGGMVKRRTGKLNDTIPVRRPCATKKSFIVQCARERRQEASPNTFCCWFCVNKLWSRNGVS